MIWRLCTRLGKFPHEVGELPVVEYAFLVAGLTFDGWLQTDEGRKWLKLS